MSSVRGRPPIGEGTEPTEVVEQRIISQPVIGDPPPVGAEPIAPILTEEEGSARVISEDERIGIGSDGTVTRQYERVEQEAVRRRRTVPALGWALLALLALLAGLAAWWYFSRTETKQVPGVTGVPVATAVNLLQDQGFKAAIANKTHAEQRGIVFAQDPGAGEDEKKGSTVQILVSQGPAAVIVPNTVGLSEATARDRIAAAGFKVAEVKIFAQQPAGTVTAQNPVAGAKAPKGASIRINVSKGTGVVIVPNVVGQTLGDAETQLAKTGLIGAVQFRVPSAQPAGTVVAQHPPGGQARKGSNVALNVSLGAPKAPQTTSPTGTTVSIP